MMPIKNAYWNVLRKTFMAIADNKVSVNNRDERTTNMRDNKTSDSEDALPERMED